MQGRTNVARNRMTQMIAAANVYNPYEVALSANSAAEIRIWLREYRQAEEFAAQALACGETSICGAGGSRPIQPRPLASRAGSSGPTESG
jgi:hypothetical protein